jgi:hypothetical protein
MAHNITEEKANPDYNQNGFSKNKTSDWKNDKDGWRFSVASFWCKAFVSGRVGGLWSCCRK